GIALAPDLPGAYAEKMRLYTNWEGHVDQARAVVREALSHMDFGKFVGVAPGFVTALLATDPDPAHGAELTALRSTSYGGDLLGYFELKAKAYRFRGELERSR